MNNNAIYGLSMAIAAFVSLIGASELKDRSPYIFRHEHRYLICDVYVLEASEVQKENEFNGLTLL